MNIIRLLQTNFFKLIYRFRNIKDSRMHRNSYSCPLCDSNLKCFLPLSSVYFKHLNDNQYIHSIFQFETLNIDQYECPVCGSSDRDRLYYLFLRNSLKTLKAPKRLKLLDIAPAQQLREKLSKLESIEYRCADLNREDVDDRVDVTDMSLYQANAFDIIICSHVLEHVDDDAKALSELYRILKPDGWGIVMVPVNLGLSDTYENKKIVTEAERWKHFAQHDHLRTYSKKGFTSRLKDAGFDVEEFDHKYFGLENFITHGIHPRSVLYIVSKK